MVWACCNIFLNGGVTSVFYAGDIVTGTVTLIIKNKQKIETLNCKIKGIFKANWTRSKPTIPYIQNYNERKKLLDIDIDIFGEYLGKIVTPGVYTNNFHFILPDDLPSSFKSAIAKVNYSIHITSMTTCRIKRKKKLPFTVYRKVNLNHLEEFVVPSFHEIYKRFWIAGKLSMCLKIYKGFAPSQDIPFEMIIHNEDQINIEKVKINLIQKLKYSITSGYANEEKKISKVEYNINSHNFKEVCQFSMIVPRIPPTTIHIQNSPIEITYVLRVDITFPYHFTYYEDISVTVSSVPVLHYDIDDCK